MLNNSLYYSRIDIWKFKFTAERLELSCFYNKSLKYVLSQQWEKGVEYKQIMF